MSIISDTQNGQQTSIFQGPDSLLHLAEVAASLEAPAAHPATHAVAASTSSSGFTFSQALAARMVAPNSAASNTQITTLPQREDHGHRQLAAAKHSPQLVVNLDNASSIAAALLQHQALVRSTTAQLAGQPAGPQQEQHLQPAVQPAARSAAANAASTAAHRRDAALQAALPQPGIAAAHAHDVGWTEQGSAPFVPAAPPARLCRSSALQDAAPGDEQDSDYTPAGLSGSTGGSKPQQWTDEEQARLEALAAHHGTRSWSTIASCMPGRSGKQCRERYINNTPELKKGNWSPQEDYELAQLHSQMRNRWTAIARHMPGRSDNCVKNRWNAVQRSRSRGQARGSSSLLWGYGRRLQQGMPPADALAAAVAALPAADRQQLEAVIGVAEVAEAAAPAALSDRVGVAAGATAAATAAATEDVHPAALLPQQQQPVAEPAPGMEADDALTMAAAMVLKAAASQLAAGGGSIPQPAADALAAAAAAVARAVAAAKAKQEVAAAPAAAAAVAAAAAATMVGEPNQAQFVAQYAASAPGCAQLHALPPAVLAQALADTPVEQLPALLQQCAQQPLRSNHQPAAVEKPPTQSGMAQLAAVPLPQVMPAAVQQQQSHSERDYQGQEHQHILSNGTQMNGGRTAHNTQPQQLHEPAMEWQQLHAPEFEQQQQQQQHGYNMQQHTMASQQQMAPDGLERFKVVAAPCVVGEALQQTLSAATAAAVSGDARAAAAAVVAATGGARSTAAAARCHPAAALAAGAGQDQPLLDAPGSWLQQQQQQGGHSDTGEATADAAAVVQLLHASPSAAGCGFRPSWEAAGLVLDNTGYQQPQQVRLRSLATCVLPSAASAPCAGSRLLAACRGRQQVLEQHLALDVAPLPAPQQHIAAAREESSVAAAWWEQERQHWPGSQQQVPPAPAAVAAGAEAAVAAAAATGTRAIVSQPPAAALDHTTSAAAAPCMRTVTAAAAATAAAGASEQHVLLAQLAATAGGRALLEKLWALLPAQLPQAAFGEAAAAWSSVPAVDVAADRVAAVFVEAGSPVGSNCSSRSKAPAVDAEGAVQAASRAQQPQGSVMHTGNSLAGASATVNEHYVTAYETVGTTHIRLRQQQQQPHPVVAAASATPPVNTYAVGDKRPIDAVLPEGSSAAAVAAAKHVLHSLPPWQGQAAP